MHYISLLGSSHLTLSINTFVARCIIFLTRRAEHLLSNMVFAVPILSAVVFDRIFSIWLVVTESLTTFRATTGNTSVLVVIIVLTSWTSRLLSFVVFAFPILSAVVFYWIFAIWLVATESLTTFRATTSDTSVLVFIIVLTSWTCRLLSYVVFAVPVLSAVVFDRIFSIWLVVTESWT